MYSYSEQVISEKSQPDDVDAGDNIVETKYDDSFTGT